MLRNLKTTIYYERTVSKKTDIATMKFRFSYDSQKTIGKRPSNARSVEQKIPTDRQNGFIKMGKGKGSDDGQNKIVFSIKFSNNIFYKKQLLNYYSEKQFN